MKSQYLVIASRIRRELQDIAVVVEQLSGKKVLRQVQLVILTTISTQQHLTYTAFILELSAY